MQIGWVASSRVLRSVALIAVLILIPAAPDASAANGEENDRPVIDAAIEFVLGSVVLTTRVSPMTSTQRSPTRWVRVELIATDEWSITETSAWEPWVVADGSLPRNGANKTTFPVRISDYNASFGGGSSWKMWDVEASRVATTSTVTVGGWLHVVQEDGTKGSAIRSRGPWKPRVGGPPATAIAGSGRRCSRRISVEPE